MLGWLYWEYVGIIEMRYYPLSMDKTEGIEWGDILTIKPDYDTKNWQVVMDGDKQKIFVAVPRAYETNNKIRRIWDKACQHAAKKKLKKVALDNSQKNGVE